MGEIIKQKINTSPKRAKNLKAILNLIFSADIVFGNSGNSHSKAPEGRTPSEAFISASSGNPFSWFSPRKLRVKPFECEYCSVQVIICSTGDKGQFRFQTRRVSW